MSANSQYSSELDNQNIIYGRVEPHIYSFSTQSVPNYIKVGDTYRPLEKRLNEWREYFPNLKKLFSQKAKINDETYYRDYAIHFYLETELHKERLAKSTFKDLPYFSNEFFRDTNEADIKNAIKDIGLSFKNNDPKYRYYKFEESRIPVDPHYKRIEKYKPKIGRAHV